MSKPWIESKTIIFNGLIAIAASIVEISKLFDEDVLKLLNLDNPKIQTAIGLVVAICNIILRKKTTTAITKVD